MKRPGDGKVVVSWSPTQNTFGYRVMYTNKEVSNVVVVNESTASNATTSELTAGVQYTISVQAFGHLPSSPSDPVLISLLGIFVYVHSCSLDFRTIFHYRDCLPLF